MNNTERVFKELRLRWSDLTAIYKPDEKIGVGLRFKSGEIRRADANFEQILELLHLCFEGEHSSTADLKNSDTLLSLFICDSTGNPFYDSNDYKPSKNKYTLQKDGDRRLTRYAGMLRDEQEQILNLTIEQIHGHIDEVTPDDDLNKKQGSDSPWGEMPW